MREHSSHFPLVLICLSVGLLAPPVVTLQQAGTPDSSAISQEPTDPVEQYNLGIRYAKAIGVPKNYAEAAKWFRKSSDQGHARAQSGLGSIYFDGLGVEQSFGEAAKWFRKAAELRDELVKKLTREQISKAQRLAREWWEKHKG